MGLFGSIGKIFGGVIKAAGTVAGVAGAIAPIPGLGAAGKVARGLGGILSRGKQIQTRVTQIAAGASGGGLKPGVIASFSPIMPGGAVAGQGWKAIGTLAKAKGISKGRSKRKKAGRKQTYYRAGRRIKRRRGYARWTRAQLRAGFGGRRRMRAAR